MINRYKHLTNKTVTAKPHIQALWRNALARDYQLQKERALDIRCVAAPILNSYNESVADISISSSIHCLPNNQVARIDALVWDAAQRMSRSKEASF